MEVNNICVHYNEKTNDYILFGCEEEQWVNTKWQEPSKTKKNCVQTTQDYWCNVTANLSIHPNSTKTDHR